MKTSVMKSTMMLLMVVAFSVLSACSAKDSDPGPLKGKWHITGIVDTVMTFRDGETETNKIVEKCTYKVDGKKVLVTYQSGIAKGMTQTYYFVDKDTVEAPLGTMKRIQ